MYPEQGPNHPHTRAMPTPPEYGAGASDFAPQDPYQAQSYQGSQYQGSQYQGPHYPGGQYQEQPYQEQPYQEQPPQPTRSSSTTAWLLATVAGLVAAVFAVLWLISLGSNNKSNAQPPATVTQTQATTVTTTETSVTTTTTTVTKDAPAPTPRPAPDPDASWPPAPTGAPSGFEWARMGPYDSVWTCDQAASQWPASKTECFRGPDGRAYFYGMRQAA